jgi:DNA-binding transcriptional LysR family regulator
MLIGHARLILGQVEQMRGALRPFAAGLKGRIRLLANTSALAAILPPQLCRFLSAHADLSVDLGERPSNEIAIAIADGRADLGVAADITDLTALQTRLLALDQLVVAFSQSHPLAGRKRIRFTEIVGDAFVGLSDAALEIDISERASRLGRQIHSRVRLRNVAQLVPFIAAGVGIAILPSASTAALIEAGLAVATVDEPWASRRLYLCARDFSALTPQAGLLARHLMTSITAEAYSSVSDPAA